MEKFINFAKKYCLAELLLIFAVSAVLFFLFYGKQDVYLVDVSREAYLPWQVLKGQVLYKDIFNVYGPLGYQINAVLYFLFGINLNTLYFAGFINSLVILFTVFYTVKLFTDKKTSLAVTGLVMFVCVYARSFFNFIFTYSYNAVYALSGFLLSLFCALLYIKERKTKNLVLAFLFAGFSFANKIEDLPYFCFLFLMLPFWLKKDWKKYLYTVCAFFAFPVISFGILMFQGAGLNDFLNAAELIKKLVNAPATTYFYYAYGLYFNPQIVKMVFFMFLKAVKALWIPFVFLFAFNYAANKYCPRKIRDKEQSDVNEFFERHIEKVSSDGSKARGGNCDTRLDIKQKFLKYAVVLLSLCISFYTVIKTFPITEKYYHSLFCWIGLACLAILGIFIAYYCYQFFVKKEKITQIELKDRMFLFLLLSALCVSFKGLFDIVITCYGTFTLTALIMPFIIFLIVYVPRRMPEALKQAWCSSVFYFCIMAMAASLFYNLYRVVTTNNYTLNTQQGLITIRDVYPSQNELIKYIREKTPEDAKILTMPEGAMINFLSQRDSDNNYYYLIPVNVEIFGQESIVENLKKNPPDYILMNDLIYGVYASRNFCGYAPKVCEFVAKEYKPEISVKGLVSMVLYKKVSK